MNLRNLPRGFTPLSPSTPGAKRRSLAALAGLAVLCSALATDALAINPGDADAAFNAFNSAYLINSGGKTYYTHSISNRSNDGTWTETLSIQGAEDHYERVGTATAQTLVQNLCSTFLTLNPAPWSYDGWNDNIGWNSLVLIRGYQMTGVSSFLTAAESGFNFAYNRGWDTQYNGGGIWEEQPSDGESNPHKEALSNDSLCLVALMIYQSTGDTAYLNKATTIYNWVHQNIFNPSTGQVYTGINTDGTLNTGKALYNQGTFIDLAALFFKLTRNTSYLTDAQNAVAFSQNNLMVNGICSNGATYLNTWAAEFARGLGHLVRWNPDLLDTYYTFMVNNANAAWGCRRTDYNVCWNKWTAATPTNVDILANWDVNTIAMLEFTPPLKPLYFQTNNLTVASITSGITHRVLTDSGFAGGAGTILDATAVGNYVTYLVPSIPAGTYDVRVGTKNFPSRGLWQLAVGRADNFSGTSSNVASPQDEYSSSADFSEFDLGNWKPATTSDKWFRFMITGKNTSSSGYSEAFNYIQLIPQ